MAAKKKRFSKKELNFYQEKLFNLRDEIYTQMQDLSEETLRKSQKEMSGDFSGYSIHMADVATDNYDREFNLGLVSNERKVLLEIDEALNRIKDSSYGICLKCEEHIDEARLNAIPYARYCKACKEKLEKEERT